MYRYERFKLCRLLLALLAVLLLAGSLAAQNITDGVTPVNQGVCDGLKAQGVTPGLYGLCVAYCEALDCPDPNSISSDPDKAATRQCKTASPKILARYNSIKKDSDPGMACVRTGCPCWTPAELSKVGTTYPPATYPSRVISLVKYSDATSFLEDLQESFNGPNTTGLTEASVVISDPATPTTCQYVNIVIDWSTGGFTTGTINSQEITATQAQVCRTELDGHVADLLSTGMSVPCFGNMCPP